MSAVKYYIISKHFAYENTEVYNGVISHDPEKLIEYVKKDLEQKHGVKPNEVTLQPNGDIKIKDFHDFYLYMDELELIK